MQVLSSGQREVTAVWEVGGVFWSQALKDGARLEGAGEEQGRDETSRSIVKGIMGKRNWTGVGKIQVHTGGATWRSFWP